jgi:hypothetical protein
MGVANLELDSGTREGDEGSAGDVHSENRDGILEDAPP